ncbi:putative MccF-like protein (microcin C7 resistance) [Corynebacterium mustelae]|uniref:Putative MccF-like protein (Microcin C7 resistance) n=1 Tax=Corynebacterium mustelae TaxID=571915 RepID=A0A0G3GUH3_9CORY|nr:S66 peptidase family protein [Corynebacterium mustelae]AKK04794.1 putative MccF-like protein (microcin C7 resistance) [Corynebacterium mustelae]
MSVFPKALSVGSHIRVIAPSDSLAPIETGEMGRYLSNLATRRLESLGFRVSFSSYARESGRFEFSSVDKRLHDLHEAFADKSVDGIITVIGGTSSHELLPYLNFDLIADNPKFFCGYSDITALQNAIYARTGVVTYSGPHWSSFGMRDYFETTQASFQQAAMSLNSIEWKPSSWFTDDSWFIEQDNRVTEPTSGWWIINDGCAQGTALGSNLSTFTLLNGTRFLPQLAGSILFAEVTAGSSIVEFRRRLFSVLQQPGGDQLAGLVIGRFQKHSTVTREDIEELVSDIPQLSAIPVVANLDFGHTNPQLTFPIGGQVNLRADSNQNHISLVFTRG